MARLSHAQHFAQHFERGARFLQGLAQDHIIEGLVGKIGQRVLNVAVKNRDAAGNGLPHFRAFNLHAACIHALVLGQPGQQFAFATA